MRGARLVPLILDCVANEGHTEIVKALLAAGADKSLKTKSGGTALAIARTIEVQALLR